MRRLAAALMVLPLLSGPAGASGSIACVAPDNEASIELTIGSLPVLAVVGVAIEAQGESWTLSGEGEQAIAVGQAFGNANEMRIDFTDPNIESIVAEVRLFSAAEERELATAGTLRIAGVGAWVLTCTGP
ncbi:hypothetical protein [Chelativorans sp. YIM 93263]|uniref:hypothetical protein n=1 Tax=Chelativorans sp. YIM 93263 TaxID=2906648 RepID=UPI002378D49C|nr:hypothetical protein [Chelativorans sp. YIM 93263]